MLRLWVSVPWVGDGTVKNPFQPDLSRLEGDVIGWALAGTDGNEAIVYCIVVNHDRNWAASKVDILHGEDVINQRGQRESIPDVARTAVENRAKALNIPIIDMNNTNVNPAGLVI